MELDKDLKNLEAEAIREGNLEKVVKIEDVYKMHTYRDALQCLQCRASIVVYPGDNPSTKVMFYYSENKNSKYKGKEIEFSSILCSSTCGVGYMGLRPSEERK
jgi:hypothetical protein